MSELISYKYATPRNRVKLGTDLARASLEPGLRPVRSVAQLQQVKVSLQLQQVKMKFIVVQQLLKFFSYDTTSKKNGGQKGTIGFDLDDTLVYKNHRVLPDVVKSL